MRDESWYSRHPSPAIRFKGVEEQTSAPAAPNSYREFCQRLELEGDVVGQGEILLGKILALGIAPDTASKVCGCQVVVQSSLHGLFPRGGISQGGRAWVRERGGAWLIRRRRGWPH